MILNGSEVISIERDKSERYFIRYFMDKGSKLERFFELEVKYGKNLNYLNFIFLYSVISIIFVNIIDGFIKIIFIMIFF